LGYWLVEVSEHQGAQWGFLIESERKPAEAFVIGRMRSLGRVIELSGQTVDVARLDLSTIRICRDATRNRVRGGASRYGLEGGTID
jgi:hypothetical protein